MFLAYDGICFDVLLLNHWDIKEVSSEDGVDFLYWHHLIDVTVVINPNLNVLFNFPVNQDTDVNSKLRGNKTTKDDQMRDRNVDLHSKGLLVSPVSFGDLIDTGSPTKTQIDTGSPAPAVDGKAPDPSNTPTYGEDSLGNIVEIASNQTPSYPPVTEIAPGIPYQADLAVQTGPINETLSDWTDTTASKDVAPASFEATFNDAANNPTIELTSNLFGFFRGILEGITGDSLPPTPQYEPSHPPQPGQIFPPPPARRGAFPNTGRFPATDAELRNRLSVPRRKLDIWINSGQGGQPEFILSLPYDGCTVDARDGPRCIDMPTVNIIGNVTGIKRLVFECFEAAPLFFQTDKSKLVGRNEAARAQPDNQGLPAGNNAPTLLTPPIISNRWEMKQIPDPKTYLNSTVINGTAVFRLDVLSRMGITADQLRPYIMPPIPSGYVRRPPEVVMGSAANEVKYTVIDDQQMLNNPGGLRWGVHSVVLIDEFSMNNPIDVVGPAFENEKK